MAFDPSARANRPLQIGRYQILDRIATGGMGAVYKALDLKRGREVALKVLPPDQAASRPVLLERFRLEARYGRRFNHENVVSFYHYGTVNGIHYLALEYVDGIDLETYAAGKGPLDPEESRQLIIQATKAIDHLHRHGIIHRDIKPSNFLVTKKKGKEIVKLIDLGLARRTLEDRSRMTQDGSSLGTVDYMSPEQARNASAADIRSDIYSLGCTWYHLLAGKAPFAEGTIMERVYKHIDVDPPDIRQFNPKVPNDVIEILGRMLAKDPARRYQTPADLLVDLVKLAGSAKPAPAPKPRGRPVITAPDLEKIVTMDDSDASVEIDLPAPPRPGGPRRLRDTKRWDWDSAKTKTRKDSGESGTRIWLAGAAVILLAAGSLVVWAATRPAANPVAARTSETVADAPRPTSTASPDINAPVAVSPKREEGETTPGLAGDLRIGPVDPSKLVADLTAPRYPQLYSPAKPIDVAGMRAEFERPWQQTAAPSSFGETLRVRRFPIQPDAKSYPSLAAACAAARPGQTTLIEVEDNGPFLEPPLVMKGGSLVIRAASGFHPLVAWNLESEKGNDFISVAQGNLGLEHLELVVQCAEESHQGEPLNFCRVTDGDLTASGCIMSMSGRHPAGVTGVRLEGSGRPEPLLCRLEKCWLRGAELIAVAERAPQAHVLIEGCLVTGGAQPLVDMIAPWGSGGSTLRIMRSTLVAEQTLLTVASAPAGESAMLLQVHLWDSLLARSASHAGGSMLALLDRATPADISWSATNALYAGWDTLVAGPTKRVTEMATWRQLWHGTNSDSTVAGAWPPPGGIAASQALRTHYRTQGTATCFAATSGPGVLGCELAELPPSRDNWLSISYDGGPSDSSKDLDWERAPAVPPSADQLYAGGRVDLTNTDLGVYLENMRATRGLAPRVVMHLAGSGDAATSPIRLEGVHLTLFFEPAAAKSAPLTLVPRERRAADREALIEINGGGLEILGGSIRLLDHKLAPLPAYMLKVQRGRLVIAGCRLEGPLWQPPQAHRGLIWYDGPAEEQPGQEPDCTLFGSLLVSNPDCLRVTGSVGRMRIHNCVVITGRDAICFDYGAGVRPGALCSLRHNTFAFRRAFAHVTDVARWPAADGPLLVDARANAFLSAFRPGTSAAGILGADGESLAHGLIAWRGRENFYDKRLLYYVAVPAGAAPAEAQPYSTWQDLWGSTADKDAMLHLQLTRELSPDKSPTAQLDVLSIPRTGVAENKIAPGANLAQFAGGMALAR